MKHAECVRGICSILYLVCAFGVSNTEPEWGAWGSGLAELLHSFPADSPFVAAGSSVNCSQRFWLPSSSPVCWENVAGPEDFEKSRMMVLQNRAALRKVSAASGVAEGNRSYSEVAKDDVHGVRADHLDIVETANTMQQVFQSLEERRKEITEYWTLGSLKDRISVTKDSIQDRIRFAGLLEKQLAGLEGSFHTLQLRIIKLLAR